MQLALYPGHPALHSSAAAALCRHCFYSPPGNARRAIGFKFVANLLRTSRLQFEPLSTIAFSLATASNYWFKVARFAHLDVRKLRLRPPLNQALGVKHSFVFWLRFIVVVLANGVPRSPQLPRVLSHSSFVCVASATQCLKICSPWCWRVTLLEPCAAFVLGIILQH